MTVKELAQELNATVPEIFEHYQKILVNIPEDEDYELNDELVKRAIPNYSRKIAEVKPIVIDRIDLNSLNINEPNKIDEDKFNSLLAESTDVLINTIKNHNNLNHLVLSGRLKIISDNINYGFFEDILDKNGNNIYYPNYKLEQPNLRILDIFIPDVRGLIDGYRYFFDCELSRNEDRILKKNPYLLQTTKKRILKSNRINDIEIAIKEKEATLSGLEVKQVEYENKIENFTKIDSENEENIQIQLIKLEGIKKIFEDTQKKLVNMESLIQTLKDRVLLCNNLDFISSDDECKYLDLLTAKEYNPINHLDFTIDFERDFSKLADHIHAYLYHVKNLIYTPYQIRNFLTLLRTNDIIVLSGLSGSGKTQIIKSFAEAMGGVVKIIPVKPNWTSSDDLIGYYNPLQMSFLPTPFTEAIVEAIHNPNQLYFICLDEMNLARVEYYFADFLSKLEERNTQPEIELYANHEEELFVSEFSTLLNLVESSIKGKEIKSWQDFLNNEEARTKFFDMLGNSDKESMLQLHAKMKRRLIDILKFPSTIKIPSNVHFVGAINVDETTHYFSPKILDRVHIVKFENPLLFEDQVNSYFEDIEIEKELLPVYVAPNLFSDRKPFPAVNNSELTFITDKLKEINQLFLLPLNIDFGIRSIRQSLNYTVLNKSSFSYGNAFEISLNSIILQKILPRFIFDGNETAKNGKSKNEIVEELNNYLSELFSEYFFGSKGFSIGVNSSDYLVEMINQSKNNNSQFNFFA